MSIHEDELTQKIRLIELSHEIVNDKLEAGAGGIEWMVINFNEENDFLDFLKKTKACTLEQMHDSLILEDEEFGEKHGRPQRPALFCTLHTLRGWKETDYDRYFEFINLNEQIKKE